jgi:hypothetical protein
MLQINAYKQSLYLNSRHTAKPGLGPRFSRKLKWLSTKPYCMVEKIFVKYPISTRTPLTQPSFLRISVAQNLNHAIDVIASKQVPGN